MTRRIVYGVSLWIFLGAAACTIASIALPNWITLISPTSTPHDPVRVSYGLHKRCSTVTHQCIPFPQQSDCLKEDRYFCSIWRSIGFFMNFSLVLELAVLVAYITILVGGRNAREAGWKILAGLLSVVAAGQLIAMALVAHIYETDNRFFVGWNYDKSFVLCTVSWSVLALNALGVVSAAYLMHPEDDYEPIP